MEKSILIDAECHQLSGVLHIPTDNENEKKPAVVICHGFIGSKVGQHRLFVKMARQLCLAGFIVLRFDFSGCGESTGEYRDVTLTRQIEEAGRAIDVLLKQPNVDAKRITLLGHSLGGAIASTVAAIDNRIDKLILLSPVANPFYDIVQIVGRDLYKKCLLESVGDYEGFEIGRGFFLSLAHVHPLKNIQLFRGNVLLIHGSEDKDTPLENSYEYQSILNKRQEGHCSLHIIKGADHTYNSSLWERNLQAILTEWLSN